MDCDILSGSRRGSLPNIVDTQGRRATAAHKRTGTTMAKPLTQVTAILTVSASILTAALIPASASPPLDTVETILHATPASIIDSAIPMRFNQDGTEASDINELVTLEEGLGGRTTAELPGKTGVSISLPVDYSETQHATPGSKTISWEDGNGVVFTPLVTREGDVQVNTIIPDANAPHSYSYEIDIPSNAQVVQAGDAHLFIGADGSLLAGLAPPWATDANGKAIPTRFEIEGKTVTQIIDFNEATVFPVVADPFLGKNLFSSIGSKYGKYYGVNTNVVTLNLSAWGWAVYINNVSIVGFASGQYVLNDLGWKEALAKGGKVKALLLSKPSMRQQFSCHALGAPFAGTWELETFRKNRTRSWTYGVGIHRCNWVTADGK